MHAGQVGMLVHGVSWDSPSPSLRLFTPDAEFLDVALALGSALGLRVIPGVWCLGHTKVHGPGDRTHIPCPGSSPAERGKQCGACFARDDSRLMHDFHRGTSVPAGLRAYLMQPHWLYVATFANCATKVGTASAPRKWNRLAEQGAVHASYVAHAEDGRVVRVLEDMVTCELGLVQQVRSASKAAGLVEPRAAVELLALNRQHAGRVRELLGGLAMTGYAVVEEEWDRPALAERLCGAGAEGSRRHPYPATFDGGGHGLRIRSLSGAITLAGLPDATGNDVEGSFVADLGALKGRKIEFGPHTTVIPALQDSLF
ncbi:DUF2797 domain-containing protein [Paenarthrobacter aurescens]|nr:DUF2797 domain-containing protein [Paenarthrobacter aurescens]MDO6144407.1 DUF2797 domain-containing protein [Paenarthrobacter aurescens]MDO6148254.1 DUF2797 domain-containing protein [Paenarthrobacter aurescens]MDO6159498.1 DUF2797 domain-containing protein [Paenarthrobacter aurescens]MDO6163481.1 DUF2797 domain-containing protein [Paenarthrobacter aurescens]